MRINRTREAFTLIELLVVVAILAVLIAILVPSLGRARQQAYQIKCMANLKNIGLGIFLYVQDQNGSLPALSGRGRDLGFWPAQVARYARVKRSRAGSRDGFFRCPADEEPTYFHISGPTPGQYATMQDKLFADRGQATDGGGTTRSGALGAGQTPHTPMPLIEPVSYVGVHENRYGHQKLDALARPYCQVLCCEVINHGHYYPFQWFNLELMDRFSAPNSGRDA